MQSEQLINYNINGLHHKLAEFEILCRQHNPAVICLTDTRLTTKNQLRVQGYTTYRDDMDCRAGAGGVAILVRRDIVSRGRVKTADDKPGTMMVTVSIHLHIQETSYFSGTSKLTSWNCITDNELGK